jgi:uncharacterized membrane protein
MKKQVNTVESSARRDFSGAKGIFLLWAGWVIGPLAWMIHLSASYLLVEWVCKTASVFPLYIVTGATLLMAAAGIFLNWRIRRRLGTEQEPEPENVYPGSRFMSLVGLLISILFFVVIVAQSIPVLIIRGCT